jgi:hypothetical protein
MSFSEFWMDADKYAYVATVVTAAVASIALIFSWAQIRAGRMVQREAYARELYRDYLKIAFEYPQLANPSLGKFDFAQRTIDDDRKDFERYEWFISFLLDACDEILRTDTQTARMNTRSEWYETIRTQISFHRGYLTSDYLREQGYLAQYSPKLREIIEQTLADNGEEARRG